MVDWASLDAETLRRGLGEKRAHGIAGGLRRLEERFKEKAESGQ